MKKIFKDWKNTAFFGFFIILLALLLRLYNLTYLPIFADEAIYVRWAQIMQAESTLRFLPLSDGKQPLFMWSMIPFLKIFNDPLYAGRFLSVLTGLFTLGGIFFASYFVFKSKKVALLASLIYAISPFSIFFDRMALVDSMLAMFGIWTLILAAVAARTLRLDFAMLAGFSLGGALLTKSPALFFAVLLPTSILVSKWPKIKGRKLSPSAQGSGGSSIAFSVGGHLIKLIGLWGVTLILGYGLYNILRLGPEFHMISLRNKDYVFPLNHALQSPLDPFIPFSDRILEYYWILGPSLLVIFIVIGIVFNLRKYFKEILFVSTWAFLPIILTSEYSKTMTARYVYFTLPFLVILSASSFLQKGKWEKLLTIGLALFIIHAFVINRLMLTNIESAPLPGSERSGYLEEWTAGTGIREVAELIRGERKNNPEENIVVGTEGFFGTLPDGLQIYLNNIPNVTTIGVGLNMDKVPQPLLESRRFGNRTFLVVNSSRLKINKENWDSFGLRLVSEYPKALRLQKDTHEFIWYGPRDYLYFFEVTEKALSSK